MKKINLSLLGLMLCSLSTLSFAGDQTQPSISLTNSLGGYVCIAIFILAYTTVIFEERLRLKKSIPVIIAAGLIWFIVGILFSGHGEQTETRAALEHSIIEFAELFLFLLAAMTFINSMQVFDVFEAIRAKIIRANLSYRGIFWVTGLLAFLLSPIADNLTSSLVMTAVVMAIAQNDRKFIALACINIVVAANAGGSFSPFGDITTLMVWQAGKVVFFDFFALFLPSVVNWIIPASIISFCIMNKRPDGFVGDAIIAPGGYAVIALFILAIILAVIAHNNFHLPPVLGMMTGLGLLQLYAWFYNYNLNFGRTKPKLPKREPQRLINRVQRKFDIFHEVERAEWDTLLFFYGIVLCVGGLSTLGYMGLLSNLMYDQLGTTPSNILVGILSALIDNIPVMFAVLTMDPQMSTNQWLLVTLSAGVGGSLLSIGSAAGVAVMGQTKGIYTFASHLKWSWAIALGFIASIFCHYLISGF